MLTQSNDVDTLIETQNSIDAEKGGAATFFSRAREMLLTVGFLFEKLAISQGKFGY